MRLVIIVVAFVLYVALEHVPVGGLVVAIGEMRILHTFEKKGITWSARRGSRILINFSSLCKATSYEETSAFWKMFMGDHFMVIVCSH